MKNHLVILLGLAFLSLSCQKGSVVEPTLQANKSSEKITPLSVADLTIETGMNLTEINTVIAAANVGDTVWVEPGTYEITGKIVMKAGITLHKRTATNPIFDATESGSELLLMSYSTELNDCLFKGITFYNIRILVNNAVNVKFWYCTFDYGKRKPGTDKAYLSDAYVQFNNTDNSIVDSCKFYRRAGNSGRGIYSLNTTNLKIINNQIGNNGSLGYFVTAINGSTNTNSNTQIQANTIRRNPTWVNASETDHGIYMHSFDGVLIKYNTISGWPTTADGVNIKVRNCQNITIFGNQLVTSGVVMYEYDSSTHPFFKNVYVAYNTITISSPVNDIYHGIGYWRNNTTGTEYAIKISNNTMPNGTIHTTGGNLDVTNFNAAGGGIYNNDAGLLNIKTGINNSGNF